jgi:A/G-specific adenine glycosylase
MLQQTQVATVIPYFDRFLQAFPTLTDLANASEHDVLRLWEGLGYYRRARDLHRTAGVLVSNHSAQIPDNPDLLRTLPGMGRYTVGAVLSQAYDRRLPILEANSQRVLTRVFAVQDEPANGLTRRRLWQLAETILPTQRAGDFNQALMELGALVCIPKEPDCPACPLHGLCAANRLGIQNKIPPARRRPDPVDVNEVAVVVRRGQKVLLVQRPATGRWANLWEFPHGPLQASEDYDKAAVRLVQKLTGIVCRPITDLMTIRHGVTHHRIQMVCLEARHCSGTYQSRGYQDARWLRPPDAAEYPVSAPQRQLARCLIAPRPQKRLFG